MEISNILSNQGFSTEEISEMQPMTSAVSLFFYDKNPSINWSQVAIFEADFLSQFTKSERVKIFALKVQDKLKQFC